MLFATRPRLLHAHLMALLVLFGGLTSGCQSSRAGFSFQPAPGRAQPIEVATTGAASEDSGATTAIPTAFAARPMAQTQSRARVRPQARPALASLMKPATIARPTMEDPAASHRRARLRRAHATAEVGLGTTVLGVLGLVVLPIALIGLLLSGGGLVWGLVAGLAALAVLVAYLDPFG